MKTIRLLLSAILAVTLEGCSQEDALLFANDLSVVYTGGMEKTASRVFLDQDNMMNWEVDDQLTIFPMYDINNQYKVVNVKNGLATFEYLDYVDKSDYSSIDNTYAVYPYYKDNKLEGNVITTFVPTEVDYAGTEESIKYALMSAKSSSERLNFTNAQGILLFRLNAVTPFKYGAIAAIKLESKTKMLSGTAVIDYSDSEKPIAKIVQGEKYLHVNLSEELQTDLPAKKNDEWAEFYIPVVPALFAKDDMKMTIIWKDGKTYEKSVGIEFEIKRNAIYELKHTVGGVPIYNGELEGAEDVQDGASVVEG